MKLNTCFFYFSFIFSAALVQAEELFLPRLGIDSLGKITLQEKTATIQVGRQHPALSFNFIKDDVNKCGLSKKKLNAQIDDFVQGKLSTLMSKLTDDWNEILHSSKVIIVISDLSDLKFYHRAFSFYPQTPPPLRSFIWIDCHELQKNKGLESTLAHEFTHLALSKNNHQLWFIESVAQLMEETAGGTQPSLYSVKTTDQIPDSFVPFANTEVNSNSEYGFYYLWGKSIISQFKSFEPFKLMNTVNAGCEQIENYYSKLICRLNYNSEYQNVLLNYRQDMTPERTLEHFKLVLSLPSSTSPLRDPWLFKGLNYPALISKIKN